MARRAGLSQGLAYGLFVPYDVKPWRLRTRGLTTGLTVVGGLMRYLKLSSGAS